uniref:(northern house mosquito) hypothetical protein n=1 Tax=Culex pipiens TaxID=7175 RepID=A0A8D8BRQ3_CULPI
MPRLPSKSWMVPGSTVAPWTSPTSKYLSEGCEWVCVWVSAGIAVRVGSTRFLLLVSPISLKSVSFLVCSTSIGQSQAFFGFRPSQHTHTHAGMIAVAVLLIKGSRVHTHNIAYTRLGLLALS